MSEIVEIRVGKALDTLPRIAAEMGLDGSSSGRAGARASTSRNEGADAIVLDLAGGAGGSAAPFDLTFIDADKVSTAEYFDWALKLSRPGSMIIVDNVVRSGGVIDEGSNDESVKGIRRFIERCAAEPRVSATAIQTVGEKGWDGMVVAVVVA